MDPHVGLDPLDLNKAILCKYYKPPTLNETSHKLSDTQFFSKLDAKNGFWSIHLEEPNSFPTTFNTHKGRYRFLCMSFGPKMSQDVFQMWMDQIPDMLPIVIAVHDNICVFSKTPQEHNKNSNLILPNANSYRNRLVFNSNRCNIRKPKITFYSVILTKNGMQPNPVKVQAIQDCPTPENQK